MRSLASCRLDGSAMRLPRRRSEPRLRPDETTVERAFSPGAPARRLAESASGRHPRTFMNPWFAKAVVLAASIAMIAIRAPHGQRSRSVPVVKQARSRLEGGVLLFAILCFFVPLVWVASDAFAFAEFELRLTPLVVGAVVLAASLWLFHRSHVDLGRNWSVTLEVREGHVLVTHGVYRTIRHPMYSALIAYGVGQALVVPNWIAGPSYLAAMLVVFSTRLGPEERLMREQFGAQYDDYRARTKRLVPGIF
jgi:protein-S-isoprenylcysteine O-methyltransferase Ste14